MTKVLFPVVAALLSLCIGSARADEAANGAIKKLFQDDVLAFHAADIEAFDGMWSEDAIYADHQTGERTLGRERILADIKQAFAQDPNIKLSGQVAHLHLLADNVVCIQYEIAVTNTSAQPDLYRFTSIAKRLNEKWQLHFGRRVPGC